MPNTCRSMMMMMLLMMLTLFSDPVVAAADQFSKLQHLKNSLFRRELLSGGSSPQNIPHMSRLNGVGPVYDVRTYGADPTGRNDSTEAILNALSDAFNKRSSNGTLITGVYDLGGAQVYLAGGTYTISRPIRFPAPGAGNVQIHGGTIRASDAFPAKGYLIDLTPPQGAPKGAAYSYEFITLRDLLLDVNYRGGGISITNSLRTSIDNCYVTHFTTEGIISRGGHETSIHNSFLGQHITGGGDPKERDFSGTAITLAGNDNIVTDVVVFSAATGVFISGQANILTGVHFYNKATALGGTGIYVKLPGRTLTRIVNCYMDYTGIVAEDPVQLLIANSLFLGDAYVLLKSVNGVIDGVNIVDNEFSGSNQQNGIVQLDESKTPFNKVGSVLVDRNVARTMKIKSTVAKGVAQGNGTSWTVDFNPILLFPNRIDHVKYSVRVDDTGLFPVHALRNTTGNIVVVESNVTVSASVYVSVAQGLE